MDNLHLNEWIALNEIDSIEIPDEVKKISIDTRDFAVIFNHNFNSNLDSSLLSRDSKVYSLLNDPKCKSHFKIHKDEVMNFLRQFKDITGGELNWRQFSIRGYSDSTGWDLKYIRLLRYQVDPDYFIISTNSYKAINKELIIKENIISYGN